MNGWRLVLDTNYFRGLSLDEVQGLVDRGFKLTVSETAITETWARSVKELDEGGGLFGGMRAAKRDLLFGRARRLRRFIDDALPVAPCGEYAVTRVRLQAGEVVTPVAATECDEHMRGLHICWRTITGVGFSDEEWLDIGRRQGRFCTEADGQLAVVARRDKDIWAEKDAAIQERTREERARWAQVTEEAKLRAIREYAKETWEFSGVVAERCDAMIAMTAWRLQHAATGSQMPAENDGSDNRLPIHLAEGFILLSRDKGFIRATDSCGTFQAPWVRRLDDLEDLPEGPPWGESARAAASKFKRRQ